MDKVKIAKILGMLGAVFAAVAAGMTGDYATAVGVLSAAFSSASVVK